MKPDSPSFSAWAIAVDERIRELEPSLEYALEGSRPEYRGDRVVRIGPSTLEANASWVNQGRSISTFQLPGLIVFVQSFSARGPSIPEFEMDLDAAAIEQMAQEIAAFLTFKHSVDEQNV